MGEDILLPEESFEFNPEDDDTLFLDLADVREQHGFEYPSILIGNVLFNDALRVMQAAKRKSFREVDVWISLEDGSFSNIGKIQLDSTILLLLHHLQLSVTLYADKDSIEVLDLNDPELLESFI